MVANSFSKRAPPCESKESGPKAEKRAFWARGFVARLASWVQGSWESRHADLSPGRGPGDGIRIVTAMTPNGHGLVAPLPAHLSHGGFCGGTPVSRQGLDPAAMGNALTTINSLPQPHSWAHGQQLQTDAFQTHGLNQQALFGQPSIVASSFFGPINDNLFGAGSSALGSTRPFSRFPSAGPASGERLFKPAAGPLSAFQEEEPRQFEPPPPPRSAPSLQYNDEPPRQEPAMPAWDEPRQGFGVTQNVNPSVPGFRSQGRKSELKVRMSDSHWESLRFSPGDDLELHGQQFVSRCGLKSAFLPGVVARLKQMAAIQQDYVMKLNTSQHRGVREEAITSIAVIAGVMEKDFVQYYDSIMPMLKQFVMTATSKKENRLRGKSFECMSLLGIAVGKEKFLNDAKEAIAAMMNTQVEADDVQREYIKEASERICTCLKKDFAQFLPPLLPGIFRNLRLDEMHAPAAAGNVDDDDDSYVQVQTGDGKYVRVHTEKFQDMMQSVQLLHTFVTEMEGGYFEAIPETAKVLLPLLTAREEYTMLCDEVRGTALQVWSLLIKSARLGAQERGQPNAMAKELLGTGLQAVFGQLEQNQETDFLHEISSGIAECIKNVGPGVLSNEEVRTLTSRVFALMDQSLARSAKHANEEAKNKQEASHLPQELHGGDEDDDEQGPAADEEMVNHRHLHDLMKS
ncbi:unnamed protein product [Cladocopium goreaui]|uniref:Importin-5 (Imp5) (Importin subunit beta-3) (Karyopherin beta-3) (Ran-binding protein 5) (RanBP5) n=1 Tax=Cladocopium goreaui TaxID=2562237 RepID=A0A9P1FVE1_9DINO|nr:unnamed protein product [Cladocopium goreaui]